MKRLAKLTTSLIVLLGLSVAFQAMGCAHVRHFWIYVQGYEGKDLNRGISLLDIAHGKVPIKISGKHIPQIPAYKGSKGSGKNAYSMYLTRICGEEAVIAKSPTAKTTATLTIAGKEVVSFSVSSAGNDLPFEGPGPAKISSTSIETKAPGISAELAHHDSKTRNPNVLIVRVNRDVFDKK